VTLRRFTPLLPSAFLTLAVTAGHDKAQALARQHQERGLVDRSVRLRRQDLRRHDLHLGCERSGAGEQEGGGRRPVGAERTI